MVLVFRLYFELKMPKLTGNLIWHSVPNHPSDKNIFGIIVETEISLKTVNIDTL